MTIPRLDDFDLTGKSLLIREDLNVPLKDGAVSSDARIRAALPTLSRALEAGAGVAVMSHLGRPKEGEYDPQFSLEPVATRLSELLGRPVPLARDWLDGEARPRPGEIVLYENVRFLPGEKQDDEELASRMAALCDLYVMDAFGTAHRAQASTHGVALRAPAACAGPLLAAELDALGKALRDPARPLLAIVGGAKVSTKLSVLESLAGVVDRLIVGGGIANTFIAAAGHDIGRSLAEPDLIEDAKRVSAALQARGGTVPVPSDVVCAAEFSEHATAIPRPVTEVDAQELILDIGADTAARYAGLIADAGTVVWNGPVGVFEFEAFSAGTRTVAEAIAASDAFSIAGGGDTLAAIDRFGVTDSISYISTGGGAFLEFLEGKTLPAVAALERRAGA